MMTQAAIGKQRLALYRFGEDECVGSFQVYPAKISQNHDAAPSLELAGAPY